MKKLLNVIFSFFKYLLLLASFGATLFVVLKLYARLEKDVTDSIVIFLPYLILLGLFILSFCLNRKFVRNNIFFNITCCLCFITNLVVVYRAIFDTNMLFNGIQKQGVNFNYFNDYLAFNRIMLYGLVGACVIFMLVPNEEGRKKKEKAAVEPTNTSLENTKEKKKGLFAKKKVEIKKEEPVVVPEVNESPKKIFDDEDISYEEYYYDNEVEKSEPEKEEVVIKKIDMDDEIL